VRVALVHDYLVQGLRGAERVLVVLHDLLPDAPVYTLVYDPDAMGEPFVSWDIRPSLLQRIPGGVRHYQKLIALMPRATERLPLLAYDLVVSSSSAWVKSVRTRDDAVHVCYCHSPARFLWHWSDEYVESLHLGRASRWALEQLIPRLRAWDRLTATLPTHYVANSATVRERIRRYWQRDATVIWPPVDTDRFLPEDRDEEYYLVVAALNPYKSVGLAIEAFNELGRPLVVVGDGPMRPELEACARPNIRFAGKVPEEELPRYYARCRAFVMPQEEDFGIAPVEAMSAGRPVIAYGAGGALETVAEGETGLFFGEQSVASLAEAVRRFESLSFEKQRCREQARKFDASRFRERFKALLDGATAELAS
jgi:glycosyltransferase involved in cell wall biosynthesis